MTVSTQLVNALQLMTATERDTLGSLLQRWVHDANIDLATPPMLGEDEAEARSASA
jgi:hypothetical protein